jgi:hypothetical protein
MYSGRAACVRQQVNAYIKSGVFDGFFDFDAAVTDAGNRPSLLALYDTWARPTDCIRIRWPTKTWRTRWT